MTQFEKLDLLLRECGGTIQTFQVLNNGISKSVFYAYVKERGLEQASHGVYVSPDTWTDVMYHQDSLPVYIAGSYDFHTAYIGNRRCIMLTLTEELATLPALKKQKHI